MKIRRIAMMKNHSLLILLQMYYLKSKGDEKNLLGIINSRFMTEELNEFDRTVLSSKASLNEIVERATDSIIKRGYTLNVRFGCILRNGTEGEKILVYVFVNGKDYVFLYYTEHNEVHMAVLRGEKFRFLNVSSPDVVKLCMYDSE